MIFFSPLSNILLKTNQGLVRTYRNKKKKKKKKRVTPPGLCALVLNKGQWVNSQHSISSLLLVVPVLN